MASILVSGLINIETTLRTDGFPVDYRPVRYPFFGVHSTVSGVGYNIARALTTLGSLVSFLSLIGRDPAGQLVRTALRQDGIPGDLVLDAMPETAQSVILYDADGRRMINTDLKDIQDRPYPGALFERALAECSLAVLCNINFSRPFLRRAKEAGKPVATDVHAIADADDAYNRDFMAAADILFMSDDLLPLPPEAWVRRLQGRFGAEIIVVGLGAQGALLAVRSDGFLERIPAAHIRPVVSTIGAGDALFSAFIHAYHRTSDPYDAIRRAVVFAAYKIGAAGAAEGFLTEPELNAHVERLTR
jgi:ribokinase